MFSFISYWNLVIINTRACVIVVLDQQTLTNTTFWPKYCFNVGPGSVVDCGPTLKEHLHIFATPLSEKWSTDEINNNVTQGTNLNQGRCFIFPTSTFPDFDELFIFQLQINHFIYTEAWYIYFFTLNIHVETVWGFHSISHLQLNSAFDTLISRLQKCHALFILLTYRVAESVCVCHC